MHEYVCRRCWATVECICSGYEPPWRLNLGANLAAAGEAAAMVRWRTTFDALARCSCAACLASDAVDTMREAVS